MTKIHDMGGMPCVEALPVENKTVFEQEMAQNSFVLDLGCWSFG